ncbi:hypothetical protein KIPB_005537 [Kipferlia bialata]|uniref:Uncharacterized protein n=1 Tax=Kipferlia bialata TaxID=797122 RepID=A0A391NW90_9EUKA|nr:hypothetical protein KIPB_005537 [Kipferlia bialata]|eukprot:g5537.t1
MYDAHTLQKFDFKSHAHEIQKSAASSPRGGSRSNSRGGSRGRGGDRSHSRGDSRGRGRDSRGDRGSSHGRGQRGDRTPRAGGDRTPRAGGDRTPRGGDRTPGRFSRSNSRGPDNKRY